MKRIFQKIWRQLRGQHNHGRQALRSCWAQPSTEELESRRMLSGDIALYHNHALPQDVNDDGAVTLHDALALHREMLAAATLPLDLSPTLGRGAPLGPAPEGEGGTDAVFFDINGDNYLTPRDAELMARGLNPEAHGGDSVHYDVTIYDPVSGVEYGLGRFDANPVTVQVDQGDSFEVRFYVQDVRAAVDPAQMGVARAYLRAEYEATLALVSGAVTHGPDYNEIAYNNADLSAGIIDYAGSTQTGVDQPIPPSPLGADPFLLFSAPFTASAVNTGTFTISTLSPDLTAPLDQQFRVLLANDPTTVLDVTDPSPDIFFDEIDVEIVDSLVEAVADPSETAIENVPNQTIDVLDNDVWNGIVGGGGNLTITDVTPLTTTNGSTMAVAGDQLSLTYNPGPGFAGVEEFIYTVTDGLTSDQALVTVTVDPINDGPVTSPDIFEITENETLLITEEELLDNDSDPEDDPFFITNYDETTPPASVVGSLTLQSGTIGGGGALFSWDYDPTTTPALDALDEGDSVLEIFRYEAEDNLGAVSTPQWTEVRITVNGVNDGPRPGLATPITLQTTDDNTSVTYDLGPLQSSLVDPEGHTILDLALGSTTSDLQAMLQIIPHPTILGEYQLVYDPDGSPDLDPMFDATESMGDTFVLLALDDQGGQTEIPFEITVEGADDPIEFTGPLTLTAFTDQTLDFNVMEGVAEPPPNLAGAFYDPDSDIVFLDPDDTLTDGEITGTGGAYTYDPNGQFDDIVYPATGLDTFVLTALSQNNGNTTSFASPTVEITIEQDVRLPVIEGVVFVDANNNGVQDPWENPISGVEITIDGVDATGADVYHTVVTGPDGTYSFAESEIGFDIIIGNYLLLEQQPEFMLDGQDLVNGVPSPFNDAVPITDAGSVPGDFVFSELGLDPAYLSLAPYLTTTPREGLFLAFDANGDLAWTFADDSWDGYTVQTAGFSPDLSTLFVTVEDPAGGIHILEIPTGQNQQYCPYSMDGDTGVLRLNGPPTDFI